MTKKFSYIIMMLVATLFVACQQDVDMTDTPLLLNFKPL